MNRACLAELRDGRVQLSFGVGIIVVISTLFVKQSVGTQGVSTIRFVPPRLFRYNVNGMFVFHCMVTGE